MAKRGQLKTVEDAVPAKGQHETPCSDCPWARESLAGWLGPYTADEWLQLAHGETTIECHTLTGAQCAGSAVYRANVLKNPRHPEILTLPADKEKVFANPIEFKKHHDWKGK